MQLGDEMRVSRPGWARLGQVTSCKFTFNE